MFSIEREFYIYAGHNLPSLGEHHKCSRLHGHTYTIKLTIEGEELKEPGLLREFADLDQFEEYLKNTYDHRMLNDCLPFANTSGELVLNPTTENFARVLFYAAKAMFPETVEVAVKETMYTWVKYREINVGDTS